MRAAIGRRCEHACGWGIAQVALFVAACSCLVTPADALGSIAPTPAADRYTPLVQSVMSTPRWFADVNGRLHVVYELELTNGFNVPVTVTSVTVNDPGRRR